ncbi:enoyl-CoA hydratase/carnithine racemase [Shimia isoporae]|uniref:Enoyl-CoA hydratase/carnithine racemase n=1 Tax=Shimia isoporae TaxID=647720 RepID=A0A4R1NVS5_9RHOB|nr:enoyl-CoA hydratase/isomerase family protein [Shimia isoporae]TCL09388.1 enoyl-CoA hydratase/carnithine racemase [Shimia isoporae]
MSITQYEVVGKTAVLTLCNGENRQNPAFAAAMLDAIQKVEEDKTVRSFVITSNDEKNWSQGIDLNWMMGAQQSGKSDEIQAFLRDMNTVFGKLLTLPVPVVASITGHAFGNGAMLASCCDFRFMRADRGYFCYPEVDVNIPFLPSMVAYIRKAVPEHRFNEMALTGRRLTADEAAADNILMAALPDAETTRKAAMDYAAAFNKGRGIFGMQKQRMHGHILETMRNEDEPLIEAMAVTA